MDIVFNGETITVQQGIYLSVLLQEQQCPVGSFAVAINECFVPRGQYDSIEILPGDRIEVVTAMQGG